MSEPIETVPVPVVVSYSGGAAPDGYAGRVWLRLEDGGPDVEYVLAPVPAARDVLAERQRQISAEGWTPEHDDRHGNGSLALAAGCYAMFASAPDAAREETDLPADLSASGETVPGALAWLEIWPWDRKWWKPKDRRSDLVRAGALILAEIERLDRAAASVKDAA